MSQTQTFIGTLYVEDCCQCGIAFGITSDFRRRMLDTRENFYCPSGHSQHYSGKTEAQRLKEELEQSNRRIDGLHQSLVQKNEKIHGLQHSNRALKAAKTKAVNRAKNGLCPCPHCKRSFSNIKRHIQSKHPELVKNKDLPAFHNAINKRAKA